MCSAEGRVAEGAEGRRVLNPLLKWSCMSWMGECAHIVEWAGEVAVLCTPYWLDRVFGRNGTLNWPSLDLTGLTLPAIAFIVACSVADFGELAAEEGREVNGDERGCA